MAEYSRQRFVVQLPSPDRPSPTYFNLALKGWGRRFESAPDRKRNGQGRLTSERNNSVTLLSCSITIVNFLLWLCDIIPKKYNPILQWIKNYSKKFLPLKGTLRNKQCLLYAKLGCARLQLQASSHCTRWHELCDDGNFSSPKECRALRGQSKTTVFEDGGVFLA